jgi:hypothetical protein
MVGKNGPPNATWQCQTYMVCRVCLGIPYGSAMQRLYVLSQTNQTLLAKGFVQWSDVNLPLEVPHRTYFCWRREMRKRRLPSLC